MNIPTFESVRRAIVLVGAAFVLVTACGDDDGPTAPDDAVQNTLVFTREDGSQVHFSNDAATFVWCGPWDGDLIPVEAVQILFVGPAAEQPGWMLKAVIDDITIGEQIHFPNSFIWDQPKDVDLFVSDPPNECSTSDQASSGFVVFQKLECGTNGQVQFSIDAVIGSEYGDGPTVTVHGTFSAPVGQPPA